MPSHQPAVARPPAGCGKVSPTLPTPRPQVSWSDARHQVNAVAARPEVAIQRKNSMRQGLLQFQWPRVPQEEENFARAHFFRNRHVKKTPNFRDCSSKVAGRRITERGGPRNQPFSAIDGMVDSASDSRLHHHRVALKITWENSACTAAECYFAATVSNIQGFLTISQKMRPAYGTTLQDRCGVMVRWRASLSALFNPNPFLAEFSYTIRIYLARP